MVTDQHVHSDHTHDHDHSYDHAHRGRKPNRFFHSHDHGYEELAADHAFLNTRLGIRTVWWALGALLLTAVVQLIIVSWSGSVALLADTVHNIGDGLNSIPLLIAFYLARRAATRRYTYGFGKAEDVAGVFIVLSIAVSAGIIFWESFQKLLNPQPLTNIGWLIAAAFIGFVGNEAVAFMQIRVGRRIGSAALVADGLHARTDGLTSLAVIAAAAGSWFGFPLLDPLIGFIIGLTILFITRDAAKTVWYRLMDAIEPEQIAQVEAIVRQQPGVQTLNQVRMRWLGHRLHAEVAITVKPELSVAAANDIVQAVHYALTEQINHLDDVIVQIEPLNQ